MELRFDLKASDQENGQQIVQRIRNPAASVHAQVEGNVLRVVVTDPKTTDLNKLVADIESGIGGGGRSITRPNPTAQALDYATESAMADLKRRAGITEDR